MRVDRSCGDKIAKKQWMERNAEKYDRKDLEKAFKQWKLMIDNIQKHCDKMKWVVLESPFGYNSELNVLRKSWPTKEWLAYRKTTVDRYEDFQGRTVYVCVRDVEWLKT
ncbi:MAG: hypothetical protein CMP20_15365 [Rickettsiales bacterium]|nr:hypothetical protein [Rickettsiales bacterium]